jgi:arsenate reductase-like glutaredoxin family protein
LLNLRSRNLKDLQVDPDSLSEQELAQLMSDNPKTMIRPLYFKDNVLVVGYDEAKLESLL